MKRERQSKILKMTLLMLTVLTAFCFLGTPADRQSAQAADGMIRVYIMIDGVEGGPSNVRAIDWRTDTDFSGSIAPSDTQTFVSDTATNASGQLVDITGYRLTHSYWALPGGSFNTVTWTITSMNGQKFQKTFTHVPGFGEFVQMVQSDRVDTIKVNKPSAVNRTFSGGSQVGVAPGTGYTLSGTYYATNAGSYVAYASLKSGYAWADGSTGALTLPWSVSPLGITPTIGAIGDQIYTGGALTPAPVVKYGATTLVRDRDYTLVYTANTNIGTALVQVACKGNYSFATQNIVFKIRGNVSGVTQTGLSNVTFTGSAFQPKPVIRFGSTVLKENTDYRLTYYSNTNAGTATVRVTGIGNYTGTKDFTFVISPKSLSGAKIAGIADQIYSGSAFRPEPAVTLDGKTLAYGTDYDLSYSPNIAVGTVTVTVNGKGNFKDQATTTFKITKKNIDGVVAAKLPDQVYSGNAFTPKPTLTYNGKTLVEGNDYTLRYSANTGAGTATITVTGTGNYSDTKTLTFVIQKANQNFSITGTDNLNCLTNGKLGRTGTVSTAGMQWSSSAPNVISVAADGTIRAVRVGSVTITLYNPGDANYNAFTATKTVTSSLTDGFYIGNLADPAGHTVFGTLAEAVEAAKNGETVVVIGKPSIDGTATVSGKTISVKGHDANAILSRGSGFSGSVLSVSSNAGLIIGGLTIDGKSTAGESLISSSGNLEIGSGAKLINGRAENGGAVNVIGGNLTVSGDAAFSGNTATGNGGAIYVSDGAANVSIEGGKIFNNSAKGIGNGIYLHDRSISLNGTNATGGISDSIGIGGKAQIGVTGGLTHKVSVVFSDPENQLTESEPYFSYVTSEVVSGPKMKEYFRVVNSGYTFNGEAAANGLVLQTSKTEVARFLDADGVTWHTFFNLQSAVDEAAELGVETEILLVQYVNDHDNTALNGIELTETLSVPAEANIKFGSIVKHTNEAGDDYQYETPENPTVVRRAASLTGEMIRVESGAELTVGSVTLDGGAKWQGGTPTVTDDGKGGAGTAVTNNQGVTAHAPILVNRGKLNLVSGALIENNDNNYAKPPEGFGSQNYGGGIRNEGSAEFKMTGGTIQNCYSREGGAIMNINKPGTSGYVENGNPSVNVSGGTIANNASQMKGAAIQTIYGGASTTVSGSAALKDNVSLHDLGTLSVEEGGALTIAGGSVSAGNGNDNAVYIYNQYSAEDYASAATKPFIEGKGAAKLTVSGSPVLSGGVHLDNPCTVVNSDLVYHPVVNLKDYSGAAIDLLPEADREYGAIASSNTDNFDKLSVRYPETDSDFDLGARFGTAVANPDGSFSLQFGGFDWKLEQTEPGKFTISGVCDPAASGLTIRIGNQEFPISAEEGVIPAQTIDLSDLSGSTFDLTAEIAYAGSADPVVKHFAGGVKLIRFDQTTGEIGVPDGTTYLAEDGTQKPLESGTLPNDVEIDADGNAVFLVDGKNRTVMLGTRAEDISDPSALDGTYFDLSDTTVSITGKAGYEYNLIAPDGSVASVWKGVSTDGETITFSGLKPDTEYTVAVRNMAGEGIIPGKFAEIPGSGVSTLTEPDAKKKSEFESAYDAIKDQLYQAPETEPTVTADEIQSVLDKLGSLTGVVKKLPHILAAEQHLKESLDHALANEWKADHKPILDKSFDGSEITDEDRKQVDDALIAFDELTDGAKALVSEESADLIAKKKTISEQAIQNALDKALEANADRESAEAIAKDYLGKISSDSVNSRTEIDLLVEKAKAALEVRTEYDKILADSSEKMSAASKDDLKSILDRRLDEIAAATEEISSIRDGSVLDLRRKQAEGIVEKHYDGIVADYESNGIVSEAGKNSVKEVFEQAIESIKTSGLDALSEETSSWVLALDRAEGKAILGDYTAEDAADPDIAAVVSAAESKMDAALTNANGEIGKIVADAKLAIEKERAKDAVEAAAREFSTAAGDEICDEFAGMNGRIDSAADAETAWLEAERAIREIELEKARADTLAKIPESGDPNADAKKTGVNQVIDDAKAAIENLTEPEEITAETERAIAEALDVLTGFDRNHFTEAHGEILDRQEIHASDLDAIDAALDALRNNYIVESQDAMNDLRDSLLAKKKAALIDALIASKDGSSADGIVDSFVERIHSIDCSGGTASDAESDAALDDLKAEADREIATEKLRNLAKDEFDRCYEAITGNPADVSDSAVKDVYDTIDRADTISEMNAALGEGIGSALDGLLVSGDSAESKEIVVAAKSASDKIVEEAIDAIADCLNAVKDTASDLEAQRNSEKTAAKQTLDEQAKAAFGDPLTDEAKRIVDEAKAKIDGGIYDEYPLIREKAVAKLEVLKRFDEIMKNAEEQGFTGTEDVTSARDAAFDAIDRADAGAVQDAKKDGILHLDREDGILELKNYLEADEDAEISAIVTGEGGAEERIDQAPDKSAVEKIVAETKIAIDAGRFEKSFPALGKSFDEIGAGDKDGFERAKDEFTGLSDGVQDLLDRKAQEDGYSGYESYLEDAIAKSEYEAKKDEILEETKTLIREHDGENVRDVLANEIERIEKHFNYELCTDDAERNSRLDELRSELDEAFDESKIKIEHAQDRQRTENQLGADVDGKVDGGQYNQAQKDKLNEILKDAQDKIDAIDPGTTLAEQEAAKSELEKILKETKEKLSEVPVVAVSVGDIKPDDDGTGDYSEGQTDEVWGIVTNDQGMAGGIQLVIDKTDSDAIKGIKSAAKQGKLEAAEGSALTGEDLSSRIEGKEIKTSLDIYLLKDEARITSFNGKYIVKILLTPELRSMAGLQVVYLDDDGSVQVYETTIEDGKYMVFTTTHFSEFFVLGEPVVNLWWLIVVLAILLLIELIVLFVQRKHKKNDSNKTPDGDASAAAAPKQTKASGSVKTYSVLPLGLIAVLVPNSGAIVCIVLGALVVGAGTAILVTKLKKSRDGEEICKTADSDFASEEPSAAAIPEETAIAERLIPEEIVSEAETAIFETAAGPETQNDDAEIYVPVPARGNGTEIIIKYDRSFEAKLIQSDEATKRRYVELKNEILSYRVKGRTSWRFETFRSGRKLLVKIQMRGKTLCLYLALAPERYEGTKYRLEDVPDSTKKSGATSLFRVSSDRRLRYAKDLIGDLMTETGLERHETEPVCAVDQYPFESMDALVARGLIKILTDEDAQNGDHFRPLPAVKAAEVKAIMTDEAAATLVEKSERVSDKTRTGIVNIDTLSLCFESGEQVTLEQIKARVPNFDRKITYVKVLARGVLDKPLTVEADDFSLDAVKMIALTGGKAIRTRKRR